MSKYAFGNSRACLSYLYTTQDRGPLPKGEPAAVQLAREVGRERAGAPKARTRDLAPWVCRVHFRTAR